MRSLIRGACALSLLYGLNAPAQDNLKLAPGYIDVGTLGFSEDDVKVDISLKGALLSLVVEASKAEDPEFSRLAGKLQAIQVQVINLKPDTVDGVRGKFSAIAKKLESDAWERAVRVRDGDHVDVYLKTQEGRIQGLVVLVLEGLGEKGADKDAHEAVFVNIVGEIDPAQIGRLGRKLHIEGLAGIGADVEVDVDVDHDSKAKGD